jgi:hypothetical protein
MEIVKKTSKEPSLPAQDRSNPHASIDLPAYKADRAKLNHTIKGHSMAVSAYYFFHVESEHII